MQSNVIQVIYEDMKNYTDIEQSRKLAEILPLESADMIYTMVNGGSTPFIRLETIDGMDEDDVLCWSLAALFGILTGNKVCHYDDRYYCQYMSEGDEFPIYSTPEYDNPVDACMNMIEKLHELKML